MLTTRVDLMLGPALRHHTYAHTSTHRAIERLSTGLRVNRAGDDPSGLAISTNLAAQVTGHAVAVRNTTQAASVLRVADAGLGHATDVLRRMRDLVLTSTNPTLGPGSQDAIRAELAELAVALDAAGATRHGGARLLDGTYTASYQVGPGQGDTVTVDLDVDVSATGLGVAGLAPTARLTDVTRTAGVAPVDPKPGTASVFSMDVADDTAAQTLAAQSGTVHVAGVEVDLAGVSTRQELAQALSVAGVTAHLTSTGVDLVADTPGPELVVVEGLEGSHTPGTDPVDAVPGTAAAVEFTVDLTNPGGRVMAAEHGTVNLASFAQDLAAHTTTAGKAAALAGAMSEVLSGVEVTVSDDGRVRVAAAAAATQEFDVVTDGAAVALADLDAALALVTNARAGVGAATVRLETAGRVSGVAGENLAAARERIVGADVAAQSQELARSKLLAQVGAAVMAQAQVHHRSALRLLLP